MEKLLSYSYCKKNGVFFRPGESKKLDVFYSDNFNLKSFSEINSIVDGEINFIKISADKFETDLANLYQSTFSETPEIMLDLEQDNLSQTIEDVSKNDDVLEQNEEAPIIKMINALLIEALRKGASDIHIDSFEEYLEIRFRIDGVLQKILELDLKYAPLIVSRIKIMSKLDITEKRIPQDGHISLQIGNKTVDTRVSTIPSNNSERVVLRLLDKESGLVSLNEIGLSLNHLTEIKNTINQPYGMILVVGPTGAGKTTTLYSMLKELNDGSKNIVTVENPIEYNIENISQIEINEKVGMTFAKSLRAILRQDPDVIMLGEIRDSETAQTAIQASQTGHLVISTMHANNTAAAITRLKDLGVAPYLISSSLLAVVSQRLVRRLCENCKKSSLINSEASKALKVNLDEEKVIYKPEGCEKCSNYGYKKRIGIYELMIIDDLIKKMIISDVGEEVLSDHNREIRGDLFEDAKDKVLKGITSLEELQRVVKK